MQKIIFNLVIFFAFFALDGMEKFEKSYKEKTPFLATMMDLLQQCYSNDGGYSLGFIADLHKFLKEVIIPFEKGYGKRLPIKEIIIDFFKTSKGESTIDIFDKEVLKNKMEKFVKQKIDSEQKNNNKRHREETSSYLSNYNVFGYTISTQNGFKLQR